MDDLEMLLPGLKVSTGLRRQRPLSPSGEEQGDQGRDQNGERAQPSVGSKRRHDPDCVRLHEADSGRASPKRLQHPMRQEVKEAQRLPSNLQRLPSCLTSGSVESDDGLGGLKAGLTSSMLHELEESPKAASHGAEEEAGAELPLAPGQGPHATSPTASALPGVCVGRPPHLRESALPLCSSPSLSSPATCTALQSPERLTCTAPVAEGDSTSSGEGASWASDSCCVDPSAFHKTNTAPPRLGPPGTACLPLAPGLRAPCGCPVSANGQLAVHRCRLPASRDSSPSPSSGPSSDPGTPESRKGQGSLSRAEKWHERICMATLRLRARSLPVTPPRTRTASLAAQ